MVNRMNCLSFDCPGYMSHAIHDISGRPPCTGTDHICYA